MKRLAHHGAASVFCELPFTISKLEELLESRFTDDEKSAILTAVVNYDGPYCGHA